MYRIARMLFVGLMFGARPAAAMQGESLEHAAFRSLFEAGQFNGAVLIAKDGKIVLDTYFGVADKLEATRKAVDLAAFRTRFTHGDAAVARAFDAFYAAPAVERAWLEARGELNKKPSP